jgi:hypothetical protein
MRTGSVRTKLRTQGFATQEQFRDKAERDARYTALKKQEVKGLAKYSTSDGRCLWFVSYAR